MLNKLGKYKGFVTTMSTYTLVNMVNAGIPFLLLPFLTTYLTKEDYGILTNINSLTALIIPLIGINLEGAVSRQFVNKEIDLSLYISSAFRTIFFSSIFFVGFFYGINNWLSDLTKIPANVLLVVPIFALLHNIIEVLLALYRMKEQPKKYGIFRILRTIVELTVSVVLITNFEFDWLGRFIGIFGAALIFGLVALFLLSKEYIRFTFSKEYLMKFLRFGVPLIPHTLAGSAIAFSDKLIISELLGIEENGVYSVGFQIGMAIALFQNSFNQAWVPWFYKNLSGNVDKKRIVKFTYLYFLGLLLLVLGLWLVTPLIFKFIGASFQDGQQYVLWIGLGFAFNGMYKMFGAYLMYTEKTKIIGFATVMTALVNIGLNFLLIPVYGLLGAAIASTSAFFFQVLITAFFSNRYYPMPWFQFNK